MLAVVACAALAVAPAGGARPTAQASPTTGEQAVKIARRYLGVPYAWGGESPRGFDCSGFVLYVYAKLGVELPHNAAAQFSRGRPVPRKRLRPGDLVFSSGLGHVAIYVGGGRIIHAPHRGEVVSITPLRSSFAGARRL